MLKYDKYFSDILCLPSGGIIGVGSNIIGELKNHKLIKWKRFVIIDGEKVGVHGYTCNDNDIDKIKEIGRIWIR